MAEARMWFLPALALLLLLAASVAEGSGAKGKSSHSSSECGIMSRKARPGEASSVKGKGKGKGKAKGGAKAGGGGGVGAVARMGGGDDDAMDAQTNRMGGGGRRRAQNRIINGRKSESHYPWMVKIVVKEGACGGALVTNQHILTAAHCFCEGVVDCTKSKLGKQKTLTEFSEVSIKGGSRKVSQAKSLKPKHVVIHKDYQSDEQPKTYDFAVITLSETYTVGEEMRPICLPSSSFEDMGQKVVTAGWGFTRVPGSCRTDGRGPKTFKDCSDSKKCEKSKGVPNSSKCKELMKTVTKDDLGKFDVFKIDGNTCYNTAAKNGWCYTDKTQSKENWGYCMRSCSSEEETTPDELEEADLETYPETSCYPGQTNKEQELCVGGKPLKAKTGVFKSHSGKAKLQSQDGGGSYDFYGYTDSCQGDSGGPIWSEDAGTNTATLLGVISRGAECGEKDQPGIAARVTTNLKWIKHQIGSSSKGGGGAAGKTGGVSTAKGNVEARAGGGKNAIGNADAAVRRQQQQLLLGSLGANSVKKNRRMGGGGRNVNKTSEEEDDPN